MQPVTGFPCYLYDLGGRGGLNWENATLDNEARGEVIRWHGHGGRVTVRIPVRDYGGKTVYHCRILDHEDLGMMGQVQAH